MRRCTLTAFRRVALVASATLATLALLPACASTSHDAKAAHAPAHDRFDLALLEGAWTTQAWGGTLNADYVTRRDGFTIGYTQLIKDGVPTYYEFEVFGRDAEGDYLVPHPAGKPAARFTLASSDADSVTYESPDKDFPTRIVYERSIVMSVGDHLIITLSDPFNNSAETQVFTFVRRLTEDN